jgi:chorismate mutase-like protein
MDISDWRRKIDDLDRRILALVNERASCVLHMAPIKQQKRIPVYEPEREEAVRSNLRTNNAGPLRDDAVCSIFNEIMLQMRVVQEEVVNAGRKLDGPASKNVSVETHTAQPSHKSLK